MMSDISCEIHSKGNPTIQCRKCTQTGLWMIPLVPETEQVAPAEPVHQEAIQQQANHLHQSSTKAETAEFYHQSLFSPPTTTLLKVTY